MSILHSVLITVNQVPPHYSYLFSCLTLTITCIIATGSLGLYLFLIDNSFQTEHAYVLVDHVFCCGEKVNKHHLDAWIKPFIVTECPNTLDHHVTKRNSPKKSSDLDVPMRRCGYPLQKCSRNKHDLRLLLVVAWPYIISNAVLISWASCTLILVDRCTYM